MAMKTALRRVKYRHLRILQVWRDNTAGFCAAGMKMGQENPAGTVYAMDAAYSAGEQKGYNASRRGESLTGTEERLLPRYLQDHDAG